MDYDGDWAKLENGYVYAGLLSEVYTYPSQIHGEDLESLKYAGYLYSDLQNLPSKIQALAETTPITLVASQEQLSKEVKDVLPPEYPDIQHIIREPHNQKYGYGPIQILFKAKHFTN